MIVTSDKNKVQRGGEPTEERTSRIRATAEAYDILSSGIYKDSITAICRELGTNAADSHSQAGKKDEKFIVHLTTGPEPFFSVKDNGVGMSQEQIFFAVDYFASDKKTSNDYTGCLGLGFKSPFAYTDQFQVTSIWDGVKTIYSCFKGEDRFPHCAVQYSDTTTEPNGVEVKFGVKKEDFDEFRRKAIEVYKWFTPQPEVGGVSESDMAPTKIVLRGDNWAVTAGHGDLTVCMGNVAYPVDVYELKKEAKLTDEEFSAARCGTILHVNIGDVNMAASRETLKFTPHTNAKLKAMISKVTAGIVHEAAKQIAACKSHYEARLLLRQLYENSYARDILKNHLVVWNGIPVKTSVTTHVQKAGGAYNDYTAIVHNRQFNLGSRYRRGRARASLGHDEAHDIEITPKTKMFYKDINQTFMARIKEYMVQNHYAYGDHVHLLSDGEMPIQQFIKQEHLEGVILPVSSLPKPAVTPGNGASGHKTAAVVERSRGGYSDGSWTEKSIEMDDGGVYVEINCYYWAAGNVINGTTGWKSGYDFDTLVNNVNAISDLKIEDIVGVRTRLLEKFQKHDDWQQLDEYLTEKVVAMKDLHLPVAKSVLWSDLTNSKNVAGHTVSSILGNFAYIGRKMDLITMPHGSLFTQLAIELDDLYVNHTNPKVEAFVHVRHLLPTPLPSVSKQEKKILKLLEEVKQRYPLLDAAINHNEKDPAILDYVKMVDAAGRKRKKASNLLTSPPQVASVA